MDEARLEICQRSWGQKPSYFQRNVQERYLFPTETYKRWKGTGSPVHPHNKWRHTEFHWDQVQNLSSKQWVPEALIQQDLGTCLDKVTAPQPLGPSGPVALGHPMTVGTQGVDLKLLQFLKTNMHGVPSYYDSHVSNTTLELRIGSITFGKKSNIPVCKNPVRIYCKAGSVSARLVFGTRAKSQDFVVRFFDDGIQYEINSPFCCAKTTITVRQS